jgi:phage tail sheath gpL-like
MALTSIGSQKTPARPIELTFAADTGTPSDTQEVLIIGRAASGSTGENTVVAISNDGNLSSASGEVETKFGASSELAEMVLAAVRANTGGTTYPSIKACVLASDATDIPTAAQTAIKKVKAEFLVTPFDIENDSDQRDTLKSLASTMSGAQRTSNNQFGTIGVGANRDVADPSNLTAFDTEYLCGIWLPDTGSPDYSLGEIAAACAAKMAANGVPFNPLNDETIKGITAPENDSDHITVGAGLESETALDKRWTPLWVKPNGEVAFVRTVTARLSADGTGTPELESYYDVQDFQVLYYWRKTLYTRFAQSDFKQRKASSAAAQEIKAEAIRLAREFESQGMFQAVTQLSKKFSVERNSSDRHRFDFKTPVNVIPGLHVVAGNIEATTEFDSIVL